jgi:hypothetical protein
MRVLKMMRRLHFVVVFFFLSLHALKAQDRLYRYALSTDFSIPSVTSSKVFNQVFDGIADVNLNFKIITRGGFYTGPGAAFTFLKAGNNRNASLSPYHTKYYVLGPRWAAGYISGNGTGTQLALGIEAGYSKAFFAQTRCAETPASPPPFLHIEPSVSLRFFSGERASFGAKIAYSLMWNRFSPEQACLEKLVNYLPEDASPLSQYLVFGLGFSVHLKALRPKISQGA